MLKRPFFLLLLLCSLFTFAGFLSPAAAETIVVSGKIKDNPKISFSGIVINPELDRAVRSFLESCGWFEVVPDGEKSDYRLDARLSGDILTLNLAMGGAPAGSWNLNTAAGARPAAKAAVDAILFKLFKVRGLCHSRIAFCAEVARGIKEVFYCDIDGGDVTQATRFNNLCVEPAWFPDGNSIGYTRYDKAHTDLVQTRLFPQIMSRRLTSFRGLNVGIAVSPDGRNLALIMSQDHQIDLYTRAVNGGPVIRLTKSKAVEASPCWSPDGRQVCFVSDETGRPQLYTINADGSGKTRLPSAGNEAVTPDWSGDNQIAYATRIGGSYTVAILDVKTGRNTRSTNVPGDWESPAWAPDHRQLVCTRSDGQRASLFIIDSWSGKVRQLLSARNNLSMPCWSRTQRQ